MDTVDRVNRLMKKIRNHVNNCNRAYDFRESFRCSVNYAGNTCWQLVSALMSSGYPNHARNWQQNSGIVEEQVEKNAAVVRVNGSYVATSIIYGNAICFLYASLFL